MLRFSFWEGRETEPEVEANRFNAEAQRHGAPTFLSPFGTRDDLRYTGADKNVRAPDGF